MKDAKSQPCFQSVPIQLWLFSAKKMSLSTLLGFQLRCNLLGLRDRAWHSVVSCLHNETLQDDPVISTQPVVAGGVLHVEEHQLGDIAQDVRHIRDRPRMPFEDQMSRFTPTIMHHHLHVRRSIFAGEKNYIQDPSWLGTSPQLSLRWEATARSNVGMDHFFATKVTTELVILSIYNQFRVATQLWIKLVYVMLVIYIYIYLYSYNCL